MTAVLGLPDPASVAAVRQVRTRVVRRSRAVLAGLLALVAGLVLLEVAARSYVVSLPDLVRVLSGVDVPVASFLVLEDTLPRAVGGLLVGVAFGVSGATCQTLLRNPLASPDLLGITTGAGTASVLAISLGATVPVVSLSALGGALAVGLTLQVLARSDASATARLVLVGVGLAFALQAATTYLLSRTDLRTASASLVWLTGSLSATTWERVGLLALALAVLLLLLLTAARVLPALETGPDTATALGVRVTPARGLLLLLAVALAGAGTAMAGPVGAVALLSGPIARRLLGGALSLPVAGLVGAAVVLGADWLAVHVVPGTVLPVGVVTGALGAPFLLWLLVRARRA